MAEIRFYVDADLLALGKSLVQARYDITYPGDPGDRNRERPPCSISPSAKDLEWIPRVATHGWVVISRDREISRKTAERDAVRDHGLRFVALDVRRDPTTWGEFGIVVARWSNIEQVTTMTGPRIFVATRSAFREISV